MGWLGWVGRVSYSWYLWQQPFVVTRWAGWGVLHSFPVDVVVSLALAVLSQRFVERPFLRLKDRLAMGVRAPQAASQA
jgi:peptidoglycan/LPS O-acetylase OafA/YrhL